MATDCGAGRWVILAWWVRTGCRRAEATIALAGPLTGAVLAAGTGLVYFAAARSPLRVAASWMALINLFNLLPVVPLDGGRVVKSIACSIGSRIGLVAVAGVWARLLRVVGG